MFQRKWFIFQRNWKCTGKAWSIFCRCVSLHFGNFPEKSTIITTTILYQEADLCTRIKIMIHFMWLLEVWPQNDRRRGSKDKEEKKNLERKGDTSRQRQKIQKEKEEIPKSGREVSDSERRSLLSHQRGCADKALHLFSASVYFWHLMSIKTSNKTAK